MLGLVDYDSDDSAADSDPAQPHTDDDEPDGSEEDDGEESGEDSDASADGQCRGAGRAGTGGGAKKRSKPTPSQLPPVDALFSDGAGASFLQKSAAEDLSCKVADATARGQKQPLRPYQWFFHTIPSHTGPDPKHTRARAHAHPHTHPHAHAQPARWS